MLRLLQVLLAGSWLASIAYAQKPSSALPRSSPEAQGIEASAILDFIESADRSIESLHSFMLVRHGQVVAEAWWTPYDSETPHQLYSLSKSFTSTAVGLAIAEGKVSLDDEVAQLFADQLPSSPSNNLKSMRLRDLLSMSTGHDSEPKLMMTEQQWVKAFLSHPVKFKPGTHFLYNTPATYMCSAIVQKKTGQSVLEFLRPRLFDPLGIDNPTWGTSPDGITLGGYGLNVRTEDIAKFGQLYLQKGKWKGQQLIPSAWVDQATTKQISNGSNPKSDWEQGYGFQFWRSRHGAYRGDGAFGQYCVVLPEQDTVVAITSGVSNMQAVLDLVWEKLLPGLGEKALPENKDATAKLAAKLKTLRLPTAEGKAESPLNSKIDGKQFKFDNNDQKIESLVLKPELGGNPSLVFKVAGEEVVVSLGKPDWIRQSVRWGSDAPQAIATSAAWTSPDTCTVKLCYVETPFVVTLQLKFDDAGTKVQLESESNVGFGPTKRPTLVGAVPQ